MKRLELATVVAFTLWCCGSESPAQELAIGAKDTIFIGQLKVQPSVKDLAVAKSRELQLKRVSEALESQLISALNATRVFQVVERNRVKELQVEQACSAVAVDPNDKNAAQTLKMAGAKFAFLPMIDGFEDRSDTRQHSDIGRVSMDRKLFLSAVVQIVDTTKGTLLPEAPSIQLSKTESAATVQASANLESDQVIVELAKEMASKLSQSIVTLLRPGKVLTVTGKQVLVNRGTDAGFSEGAVVEIYATQEIKDDDTGETFRNEVAVGKARVARADARQSFAVIEGEDAGITRGCVVRVLRAGGAQTRTSIPAPSSEERGAEVSHPSMTPGSSEKPLVFK